MRHRKGAGWELRDYAKRSAYNKKESVRGRGRRSAWTQHETQHGRCRQTRGRGCAEPAARCPLAITEKHTALHYWLFYTSREGGVSTLLHGLGWGSRSPAGLTGPRAWKGLGRRSMHKEALGDFNQALATRGCTGALGSGLHREEMAPGKVKGPGEQCRGPEERPHPGLKLCPLLPALAHVSPAQGPRMA